MCAESRQIFESENGGVCSVKSAIELNTRAIAELRSAVNIFNFLHGLRHQTPKKSSGRRS